MSGEGGMTWIKQRTGTADHVLNDTVRGAGNRLRTNVTAANASSTAYLSAFNNNGFSLGTDSDVNGSGSDYSSWTFRKAPGFFDVVTYTGTGSNRTIAHSLGCKPGLILVKELGNASNWLVQHRSEGAGRKGELNYTNSFEASSTSWNDTEPTSTHFSVGTSDHTNGNGDTFIAYLFAGGESTAATARSIELDGTNDGIKTSTSSDYDFGTGDFTVEFWIKFHTVTATQQTADHRGPGAGWCNYLDNNGEYKFWMTSDRITGKELDKEQWYHIATVRHSGTTTLYIDGISQGTYADTNDYSNQRLIFGLHGPDEASFDVDGEYSNIRIVKGTAVYTSSFRPPTAPLTNITNTKFLGANSSSVTGTTVGTAVAVGDPTINL